MLMPMKLANGEEVMIEVREERVEKKEVGFERGTSMSGGDRAAPAAALEKAGRALRGVAETLSKELRTLGEATRPTEIALEVEVAFDAEGRVLLLFASKTSASMKVSLKWALPPAK